MKLILASQSPRRQELLGKLGIDFEIQVPDADEQMDQTDDPARQVAAVSLRKAQAVRSEPDDVVIAADTIVVCDGKILGKPQSPEHAAQMLRMLSGRAHQVMTGLTVLHGCRQESCTEITTVHFKPLTDREIARYVSSGDPMDKAGAYGIQSGATMFVEGIEGDYFNVVGLPLCRLYKVLQTVAPAILTAD